MHLDDLRDVYHEQLQDAYSIEEQLIEALPKLATAASAFDLKQTLHDHLAVTERHFQQVKLLMGQAGVKPGKKCKGMAGVIEEGAAMVKEKANVDARDVGLIAAAQKAEHYEIATYGCLHSWATLLGETEDALVLQNILDEEYAVDKRLTQIAESQVNRQAT